MRIQVTAEDIEQGQPCKWRACPIALAAQRLTGSTSVKVCGQMMQLGEAIHPLPSHAQAFVNRFDRGCPVEPFEFDLPEAIGIPFPEEPV